MFKLSELIALVEAEATRQGVDPKFTSSILAAENTSDGTITDKLVSLGTTSGKGATGIGQVMPATAKGLITQGYLSKDVDLASRDGQIQLMVAALKEKQRYAKGDPIKLAIAYNAGPQHVLAYENSGGDIGVLPKETQDYLQKVNRNFKLSISQTATPQGALDNIANKANSYIARTDELLAAMQGETGKFIAGSREAEDAAIRMGDLKAASIRAKTGGDLERLDFRKNLLRSMGVDAGDPGSLLMSAQREAAVAQQETAILRPELDRLRAVSFTDDPVAWLKAQFQLNSTAQRYNSAANRWNTAVQQSDQLRAAAKDMVVLDPGVSRDAVQKEAEAEANAAVAEAVLKKSTIAQQGRQATLSAMGMEMQVMGQQFQHAEALARLASHRMSLREAGEKTTRETLDMDLVNTFLVKVGKKTLTADQFKTMNAAEKTQIMTLANRRTTDIADTPGKSLGVLWDQQSYSQFKDGLSDTAGVFLETYHTKALAAAKQLAITNPKLKSEQAYEQAADSLYTGWRKELEKRNYSDLSADSPFRMRANVFATAPALKDNSIAQYVLATPEAGSKLTPNDILTYAVGQVHAKKPVNMVAKEIRDFFYQGSLQQGQEFRLPLLGVNSKNPKSGNFEFPVDGDVFGILQRLRDGRLVNSPQAELQLFNEASITNFLVMNVAAQAANQAARAMPGTVPQTSAEIFAARRKQFEGK